MRNSKTNGSMCFLGFLIPSDDPTKKLTVSKHIYSKRKKKKKAEHGNGRASREWLIKKRGGGAWRWR